MQEKKINLALLWSKYRGNVTSIDDAVIGLDSERFNVIFVYLTSYGVSENLIEKAGHDVFYLSNKERVRELDFSVLYKLIKILKKEEVDILHCHRHKPTVYGALAAIIAKTPVVLAHVHGLRRTRTLRRKLVNYFLFKRFGKVVGCAENVRQDVVKSNPFVCPEKVISLENSVDFERFANVSMTKAEAKRRVISVVPANAFVYGMIARFGPRKGYDFLVTAFEKVKRQVPRAHMVFVGDGPFRGKVKELAAHTWCGDSIHFLGYRKDVEHLLRGMDVFVLPSLSEGMPRVILEAMAAGCPCIASAVGGIPEIITDGQTGFLVPSKDEKALSEAMIAVAKKPEHEIADIVDKAKELIRTSYTHEEVRKRLEHLYEAELESSANVNV